MSQAETLLIVDDEAAVGDMLCEFFQAHGYTVNCARNGRDALVLASLARPDAVILDVRMPGRDGPEVLGDLHAMDDSIPVVMLSGNDNEELARNLLKAGAFDYVVKPFVFDNLSRVVALAVLVGKRKTLPDDDGRPWQCDSRTVVEQTPRGGADTCCQRCREHVPAGDTTTVRERDGLYHAHCWLTRLDSVQPASQLARS